MNHYELQNDEVALSHEQAFIVNELKRAEVEVLLTNFNFVFIKRIKQFLKKDTYEVEIYGVDTVKIYNDLPHIIKKNKVVEIYFKGTEKFLEFASKKQATKFADTALRLISGQSKFVRGVKKTQKEIVHTSEELNVDIVGASKKAVGIAGDVVIGASAVKGAKKSTQVFGMIAKALKGQKAENQSLPSADNKIVKLKELKELLDSGAITQDEFEKMKAECIS